MKFKFKIQGYQTNAVENTTAIFIGQPNRDPSKYRRDLGKLPDGTMREMLEDDGYRNADVELSSKQLLENLHSVQTAAGVPLSKSLSKIDGLGAVNLDVEMETGTGKTYVYIKTMFEHNKLYGWSKFIIVVPSIAIREGVAKSFRMLEEHFMEQYGKKARWFVYNSSNLNQLDQFSQDAGLNVMIINTQAFAASLKEGGRSKESRIIYSKRDEFCLTPSYRRYCRQSPDYHHGRAAEDGGSRYPSSPQEVQSAVRVELLRDSPHQTRYCICPRCPRRLPRATCKAHQGYRLRDEEPAWHQRLYVSRQYNPVTQQATDGAYIYRGQERIGRASPSV